MNCKIRYVKPSQIAADPMLKVVLFKSALNTGWDCPRAEVMMSFRTAKDHTAIAQLIGRMVRTPLARRVDANDFLNTVGLYLPYFDADGISQVVDNLMAEDHEYVPPVVVVDGGDYVRVTKRPKTEGLFDLLEGLPSYIVPTIRNTSNLNRLMSLARLMTNDKVNTRALDNAKRLVIKTLDEALAVAQADPDFDTAVDASSVINVGMTDVSVLNDGEVTTESVAVKASAENIDDLFRTAGRRLGNGLAEAYWRHLVGSETDPMVVRRFKVVIYVLVERPGVFENLEKVALNQISKWFKVNQSAIKVLGEGPKQKYRAIKGSGTAPMLSPREYPESTMVKTGPKIWAKHLYVPDEDEFSSAFTKWEEKVLDQDITDSVAWIRNQDRKHWSFTVPFMRSNRWHPFFPDFIFIREEGGDLVADIVDPHRFDEKDSVSKARGLARFATDHGEDFGKIELVALDGKRVMRLDLNDFSTRKRIEKVESSSHLEEIYKDIG